jgi:hypothetical protein
MHSAGLSNLSLAAHVRGIAREHGADLRCTHVDVRRWLDGVVPRQATARFIASAPSRKGGFAVSLGDIGMSGLGSLAVPGSALVYPSDGPVAGQQLLDLTRRDLADEGTRCECLPAAGARSRGRAGH